ncbi:MAG: hypothetical protein B7733_23110, partial [Myxococcales bacterium FL481]
GTPQYMAPEQAYGAQVDRRADIYSVGATIFHIVTGRPPFEGKTVIEVLGAVLQTPVPSVNDAQSRPEVPAGLDPILCRALAKDPDERYASIDALLDDLERLASPAVAQTVVLEAPAAPPPRPRFTPVPWLVGGAAVAGALAVVWAWIGPSDIPRGTAGHVGEAVSRESVADNDAEEEVAIAPAASPLAHAPPGEDQAAEDEREPRRSASGPGPAQASVDEPRGDPSSDAEAENRPALAAPPPSGSDSLPSDSPPSGSAADGEREVLPPPRKPTAEPGEGRPKTSKRPASKNAVAKRERPAERRQGGGRSTGAEPDPSQTLASRKATESNIRRYFNGKSDAIVATCAGLAPKGESVSVRVLYSVDPGGAVAVSHVGGAVSSAFVACAKAAMQGFTPPSPQERTALLRLVLQFKGR